MFWQRSAWRVGVGAGLCMVGAWLAGPAAAQAPKKADAAEITDEQVVAAMQKGTDYLLSTKRGDNWEGQYSSQPQPQYKGGETAIVLYTLLHAGDSLQDDPEYHSKLHWRSKELSPVVAWLEKVKPVSTYSAGLEASALTLIPKLPGQKPWEGAQPALEACKSYLIEAMGHDGGYTYVSRLFDYQKGEVHTVGELWDDYCMAIKKGDKAKEDALKKDIDGYMKAAAGQVGGQQWAVASLAAELRARRESTKDATERAMLDAELKALEIYAARDMPAPPPVDDKAKDVAQAKKTLEEMVGYARTGMMPDPKDSKKKVPVTREELQDMVTKQKEVIAHLEDQAKTNFVPMGDLSNGQYGTLGAWALADFGVEMPMDYWLRTDRFWRLTQNSDGGWPYSSAGGETKDTMGIAGIASLFVCDEFTDTELRLIPKPDKNIDLGLKWLNTAYSPRLSLYGMYGVERVGLSSGLKFFGTTNWYKEGAAYIVAHQQKNGSWGNNVDTSYALLFLSRGRNPVVFNKLQYNGYWNARPRDDAYMTRWMSKRFEKPINWQIVNLQVSPEEWLDAPVLLITGSQDPKFTKEDLAKLRAYIDAGGMIFTTADGNSQAFTTAIKKYAAEVVDRKYEMRILPRNHELFSRQLGVDLPNPPQLMGMSNGIREIWIHSPHDVGADWQMRRIATGKMSFELGAAIYLYASGMGSLRSKLQPLAVNDAGAMPSRTIEVARLDYGGNSDPEPGAWARMARLARADFKTQVNLTTVKFGQLDPKKYPLAHLTGTTRVTFTDADAAQLKAYLNGGGQLFIDAAGGNTDFAASCEDLLKMVYPEAGPQALPPDHPIFTGAMPDGVKIGEAEFRKYGNLRLGHRVTVPLLEAVTVGGRVRVLFSRWDICSGFLGTNTWGIVGYAPSTAQALGRNILLFALKPQAAEAAAAPKAEMK